MVYVLSVWVSPVDIKISHEDGTKDPKTQIRLLKDETSCSIL